MAAVFDQVDFIICATNPDVAFPAEVSLNTRVGDERVGPENNGALTIPYNIVGNPSLSLPVGLVDGLPVGMQIAALHHQTPGSWTWDSCGRRSGPGPWWRPAPPSDAARQSPHLGGPIRRRAAGMLEPCPCTSDPTSTT